MATPEKLALIKHSQQCYNPPAFTMASSSKRGLSPVASKRLMKELQKMKTEGAGEGGDKIEGGPLDEADMSNWWIKLTGFEDPNASTNSKELSSELKKMGLDGVELRVRFNNDHPVEPPFIWVHKPRLIGGRVFQGGAMCMDLLMPQGWSPANTIPAVMRAVRSEIEGETKCYEHMCYGKDGELLENTYKTAQVDFKFIQSVHSNWSAVVPRNVAAEAAEAKRQKR